MPRHHRRPGPGLAPQHAVHGGRRAGRWVSVALVLTAVGAFATSAAGFLVDSLQGNIDNAGDIGQLVVVPSGSPPPVAPADRWDGQPITFVAIGTDDRSGANGDIGGVVDGMRSDTTMVVHISADRTRVDVVSVPRDSWLPIPACHLDRDPAGEMSRPTTAKFNEAFARGGRGNDAGLGAACALSTIAENTGLVLTDFVIIDFAGFQGMVDAIDGVRICVPEPIRDIKGYTDLDLEAGWHDLRGAEALAYSRARYVTGSDNSDTQRILRQQKFVGALARKVLSSEVLTDPVKVIGFLQATTRSLTASDELASLQNVAGIAYALRSLDPSSVTFVSIPTGREDGHDVWLDDADLVWQRLAADVPILDAEPVVGPDDVSTQPPATTTTTAPEGPTPDPATATLPPATTLPEPDVPHQLGVDPDDVLCG